MTATRTHTHTHTRAFIYTQPHTLSLCTPKQRALEKKKEDLDTFPEHVLHCLQCQTDGKRNVERTGFVSWWKKDEDNKTKVNAFISQPTNSTQRFLLLLFFVVVCCFYSNTLCHIHPTSSAFCCCFLFCIAFCSVNFTTKEMFLKIRHWHF